MRSTRSIRSWRPCSGPQPARSASPIWPYTRVGVSRTFRETFPSIELAPVGRFNSDYVLPRLVAAGLVLLAVMLVVTAAVLAATAPLGS